MSTVTGPALVQLPTSTSEDVLDRVALALGSALEQREIFAVLADITLEVTDADHCSLFLIEDGCLRPAHSVGRTRDEHAYAAFKTMGAVALDPIRATATGGRRVVAIEDVFANDVIPEAWVERFGFRSVVLVPLLFGEERIGLMTVDWSKPRRFDAALLRLLGSLGSYAGVGVRNARLFESVNRRAELSDALARAASCVAAPVVDLGEAARSVVEAYCELFGARWYAIGLTDPEQLRTTTIVSEGLQIEAVSIDNVPPSLIERLNAEWVSDNHMVEFGPDPWFDTFLSPDATPAAWHLMIPVTVEGRTRGAVLLGFDENTRLDDEERSVAAALATLAGAALERKELVGQLELQVRQFDALARVLSGLTSGGDAAELVAKLNEVLRRQGIEVTDLLVRDKPLARFLGADPPAAEEWRVVRDAKGCAGLADGTLGVPLRAGRRYLGMLKVRNAEPDRRTSAFLEALAQGITDAALRGSLRAAVEQADWERTLVAERERMLADFHDTAGQLFVAMGLLARRHLEQLPPDSELAAESERLAELADQGKREMYEAIRAGSFTPAARRGLVGAVRGLARSFECDSGITVRVTVVGRAARLAPKIERAVYRVVHEALMNAWRHGRCETVDIELTFTPNGVTFALTDDGIGISPRQPRGGYHLGVLGMRRVMTEIGGRVRVRNVAGGGVQVEGHVPEGQQ